MSESKLSERISSIADEVIALRHDLHAHPQLAYEETYASAAVQRVLTAAGISFTAGLAETGVVAWLMPTDPEAASRPAVALRADMDALPITEETGLPYASQHPGLMHACGHDGHTAVLAGAARVLAELREQLPRPVKFFFQPAEEGKAGAKKLMDDGALTAAIGGCEVGMIFGLHGDPLVHVGQLGTHAGAYMAAMDELRIEIVGHGAHAAMPHLAADPVVAAAQVIVALQSIVGRNVKPISPAVITVAAIHGGEAFNVIPDRVSLLGTIRSFDNDLQGYLRRRIEELATQVAAGMGCTAEVSFHYPYPPLLNDAGATAYAARAAAAALGEDNVNPVADPKMGGEDFAFYCNSVPGCFAFMGVRPAGRDSYPNLHTSRYDFTDDAIAHGIHVMCRWALDSGEFAGAAKD